MKNFFFLLCAGAMLMSISSCNTAPVDYSAANIETFKKFDDAWNQGDLQGALAFFADDAVVTLLPPPPGKSVYTGKAEIEEWGKSVLSGPLHITATNHRAEGNKVFGEFSVESEYFKKGLGVSPVTGTSEAVIENGKIKSFTPSFDSQTMNKALVLRFFSLLDAGNMDAIEQEVLAHEVVARLSGNPNPMNLQDYKQMGQMFTAAFPDGKHTIHQQIAEGDKVATYLSFNATHTGDFMGVKPSGKPVSIEGMTIDLVKNGKIMERWFQFDQMSLMQQIGAIPAPGQATAKK